MVVAAASTKLGEPGTVANGMNKNQEVLLLPKQLVLGWLDEEQELLRTEALLLQLLSKNWFCSV